MLRRPSRLAAEPTETGRRRARRHKLPRADGSGSAEAGPGSRGVEPTVVPQQVDGRRAECAKAGPGSRGGAPAWAVSTEPIGAAPRPGSANLSPRVRDRSSGQRTYVRARDDALAGVSADPMELVCDACMGSTVAPPEPAVK